MTRAEGKRRDWIVSYDGTRSHGKVPYSMECLRCHGTIKVSVPISVDAYVAVGKAFIKDHARCPSPPPTLAPEGRS